MTPPLYTLTVTNLTRDWSYEAVHGDTPTDLEDVHLIDPLTYVWSFADDVFPSQLTPFVAAVNLMAKSASLVPVTQIGDLVTLDVRVGEAGSRVIAPHPMRVASAEVELINADYPARLGIALVDLSVDWRSRIPGLVYQTVSTPGWGFARNQWRPRMAEIANRIGVSVGCPTTWADDETPDIGNGTNEDVLYDIEVTFEGTAEDNLTALLNSHQPDGLTHSWATVYAPSGHPTGYRRVGPDDWSGAGGSHPSIPEPDTAVRVEAVPASRTAPGSAGLPLQLEVEDGLLRLTPRPPAAGNTLAQLGLDACWCLIPATARRARTSTINWVDVTGKTFAIDGTDNQINDSTVTRTNAADVAARGVIARVIPTQLETPSPTDPTHLRPAAAITGDLYLSDESALEADWSYDAFTLRSSLIPDDVAAWLLPLIAPRLPGETDGDGRLARHVTLYNIAHDKRFDGRPVVGFVVSGQMTIAGGDIEWTLSTTPGDVEFTSATSPVTFAEMEALATAHGLTALNIDPLITLGDLAYVDA